MDSFGGGALICAAPETVWTVITDTAGYAEWDSGIAGVSGEIGHGKNVRIRPGGLARSVPVAVHRCGDRAMSWTARLPGGLFKAVRTITVTAENGKSRPAVRDDFTGPLWTLIRKHSPGLARSAEGYAEGVRARPEKLS
ncbi:SRPBCC family protein [Arthrobacter sp. efr-133-R2A-63]|uniref:SRPBCC family protein n=1 Tax=Arthrobacter sp. efr-133-R2A-63 TaxID=3040278 RepID=UPI00254D7CA3|nr:SRPBCC family protein [Arthrobacter sp. efr-133-R2A-63]